jgi:hypothetical protein
MLYLRLIILSVGADVFINNEMLLVNDSMNLNIKPTQSFIGGYRDRGVRTCVHRGEYSYVYKYLYLYYIYKLLERKEKDLIGISTNRCQIKFLLS